MNASACMVSAVNPGLRTQLKSTLQEQYTLLTRETSLPSLPPVGADSTPVVECAFACLACALQTSRPSGHSKEVTS